MRRSSTLKGHADRVPYQPQADNGDLVHKGYYTRLDLDEPQLIRYINDESNEVGRVHFGIVYVFHARSRYVQPKEKPYQLQCDFVPIMSSLVLRTSKGTGHPLLPN